MEPDIARSWEVTGITLEFSNDLPDEASYSKNSLHVFWKDPLVLGKNIILKISGKIINFTFTFITLNF